MATSDIITKAIISSSKHKYLMLIKGTYDSIPEVTFKDPWLVDEQYLGGKDKFDKLLEKLIKKIWWFTDKRL